MMKRKIRKLKRKLAWAAFKACAIGAAAVLMAGYASKKSEAAPSEEEDGDPASDIAKDASDPALDPDQKDEYPASDAVSKAAAQETDGRSSPDAAPGYMQISMAEAKRIMESGAAFRLVDVRNEGYEGGHIPGAISVPSEQIKAGDTGPLTDKDETLLVYCHRGFKSKEAAGMLAGLGYRNVYECGGIIDWDGDIEK